MGDKKSLQQRIHEITGIAVPALHGDPLTRFEVEERFKWAEGRQRTREGRANAVRRLRKELDDPCEAKTRQAIKKYVARVLILPPLIPCEAKRPSIVPFERNICFTGREAELAKLQEAISETDQTVRVAITGLGGIGKTQLALELAHRTRAKDRICSVIRIPATNQESLVRYAGA
jgi:hypothetical protein